MKLSQIILLPFVSVFMNAAIANAHENTLFAYDSLYNSGRYVYLIDSLEDKSDEAMLVRARTLATVGYPEEAFSIISQLDNPNIQAASIYYRYGAFNQAIEIVRACVFDSDFQSKIADYLIARCSAGDDTSALERFSRLSDSGIAIFRSLGDLRLAEYYCNSGNFDSSELYISSVDSSALKPTDRTSFYLTKSRLYLQNQDCDMALNYLESLFSTNWLNEEADVVSSYAVDSLGEFLDLDQSLRLMMLLRRNRLYDDALNVLAGLPANDTSLIALAWCHFGNGDYSEAAGTFLKLRESEDPEIRAASYYGEAVCDYRRGRRLDGVNKLIDYADSFPDNGFASRALFTAADFYQLSDPERAIKLLSLIAENYRDSRYYARASFLLGKLYSKVGLKDNALASYGSFSGERENADLFDYWSYKLNKTDSTSLYKIVDRKSSSFYSYMARQELGVDNRDSLSYYDKFIDDFLADTQTFISWKIKMQPSDSESLAICDSLFKYGLEYEAGLYLVNLHREKHNPVFDLAILRKCRALNLDWAFFEILDDFKSALKKYGYSFSLDTWNRLNYPILYPELVAYHSRGKTAPYLTLAVIRRESRFQPFAISNVGALGLMQLMPSTAAQMAELEHVPQHWIFEPGYNIRLGCRYLRWLTVRLSREEIVIAAYNAGPSAAKRWRRQAGTDTETYIETIGYDQSRDYTRWVIGDFYWYRYLWPEEFYEYDAIQ